MSYAAPLGNHSHSLAPKGETGSGTLVPLAP